MSLWNVGDFRGSFDARIDCEWVVKVARADWGQSFPGGQLWSLIQETGLSEECIKQTSSPRDSEQVILGHFVMVSEREVGSEETRGRVNDRMIKAILNNY